MSRYLLVFLLLIAPVRAWAALSAATVWEVRTTGATTNGGGFVEGAAGTDWSQQAAAQYSVTDGVTACTTTITSATANFGTDVVGNIMYVQGGTGSVAADWYQITARGSATSITVDRSTGLTAGTGVTLKIGGALSTLTVVATEVVAGNTVWVKSGTYAETLTLSVAGGNGTPITWEGYDATRNDRPTGTGRPLIDAAATRANCIDAASISNNAFKHFRVSGGTSSNITMTGPASIMFTFVKSSGSAVDGFSFVGGSLIAHCIGCESSGNTGVGIQVGSSVDMMVVYGGYVHDNTSNGIIFSSAPGLLVGSIVEANSATNVTTTTGLALVSTSTIDGAVGASADGIGVVTTAIAKQLQVIASAITNNGRYGITRDAVSRMGVVSDYNGVDGNATSDYNSVTAGASDVSTSPGYTNAAAGDFSLGTAWKALGWPGLFPGGLSTGYLDIGAVQRQEAGASGGGCSSAAWSN